MNSEDCFASAVTRTQVYNAIKEKVGEFLEKTVSRFGKENPFRLDLQPDLSEGVCRLRLFDQQIEIGMARMVFFEGNGRGEITAVIRAKKESEPDLVLALLYTDKMGNATDLPGGQFWEYPLSSHDSIDRFVAGAIRALMESMTV